MKLRPHHLLCTQGYSGKGYNNDFVQNMTDITTRLRNETNTVIEIVLSTDDICSKCPSMIDVDLCKDNDEIKQRDKKISDCFGIEEKEYIYQELIAEIDSKMTVEMMDEFCSDCSWYSVSACKRNVCKAGSSKEACF